MVLVYIPYCENKIVSLSVHSFEQSPEGSRIGLGAWSTTTLYWRIIFSHGTFHAFSLEQACLLFRVNILINLYPWRNLWILLVEVVCRVYTPMPRNARGKNRYWTSIPLNHEPLLSSVVRSARADFWIITDTLCLWGSCLNSGCHLPRVIYLVFLRFSLSSYLVAGTISLSTSPSLSLSATPTLHLITKHLWGTLE